MEPKTHKHGSWTKHTAFLWDSLRGNQAMPHHIVLIFRGDSLRGTQAVPYHIVKTRGRYKYRSAQYVRNQILMSRNQISKLPKY